MEIYVKCVALRKCLKTVFYKLFSTRQFKMPNSPKRIEQSRSHVLFDLFLRTRPNSIYALYFRPAYQSSPLTCESIDRLLILLASERFRKSDIFGSIFSRTIFTAIWRGSIFAKLSRKKS